ncbi:acyl-CoA thioesterase [Salinifilum ghardaiensis]
MTNAATPLSRMPLRVRYHECDPQGVVFNAHYLAYADMASFECVKELFGSHAELLARGVDLVVAESNVRYLAPCHFDEELVVAVRAERVGTTSLVLRFEVHRGDDLVAEVTNRYVWIGTGTTTPTAPPDTVRDAFLPASSRDGG